MGEPATGAADEPGFDPTYGARPLKRVIQREVGDHLALELLEGRVSDGDEVVIDVGADGTLAITAAPATPA